MKFSLTEKIEKETELPLENVIAIFKNGITKKLQLFPDQIMRGEITINFIDAVINPRFGLDGAKSRLIGKVTTDKTNTHISCIVKPSWAIIIFDAVWVLLVLLMAFFHEYTDITETLEFLFIAIIWTIIPFALSKLKVYLDKRQLEKWIETQLANALNK